jgi:hypothetical protein
MTSKFTKPVYRETDHATVRSGGKERNIIVGLVAGDVIELRLKRERKSMFISAATVFHHALELKRRKP